MSQSHWNTKWSEFKNGQFTTLNNENYLSLNTNNNEYYNPKTKTILYKNSNDKMIFHNIRMIL